MIRNKLFPAPVVDRENFLVEAARGAVVLHLGCADAPNYRAAGPAGTLLHARLAAVAKEIIGIDIDEEGVKFLRAELGFGNIFLADVENLSARTIPQRFDVIIAGELLEHLPNPGLCLRGVRELLADGGSVIITVPNAFSLKLFCRAVGGYELVHPDHVSYFSVTTMQKLLDKCGFTITSHAYYSWRPIPRVKRVIHNVLFGGINRFAPYLAQGLIVTARPS